MSAVAIVTHCWAVNKSQYAVFLRCQLSSLILHPPVTKIYPIVAYDPQDYHTRAVVNDFNEMRPGWLHTIQLTDREMWRRSIARHRATQRFAVSCDLMWFTDCDYLFGAGCLDMAKAEWLRVDRPEMIWPRGYLANADKRPVDEMVAKHETAPVSGLVDAFDGVLTPMAVTRAIGGIQIVSGAYARQHGYLPDGRWQTRPNTPFPNFRDDVAFRKRVEAKFRSVAIPSLPGLVRLRHTEIGYGSGH